MNYAGRFQDTTFPIINMSSEDEEDKNCSRSERMPLSIEKMERPKTHAALKNVTCHICKDIPHSESVKTPIEYFRFFSKQHASYQIKDTALKHSGRQSLSMKASLVAKKRCLMKPVPTAGMRMRA